MSGTTIMIDGQEITAELFAAVVAHQEAQQAAAREARKAERVTELKFLGKLVPIVADQFPARTFESGAVGWSFGGKVKVDGRDANVSMLIRWSDTIPAKAGKDSAASDAAAAQALADVEA